VIGADLRNEPRGVATWGGSAADNWQAAATTGGDAVQGVDSSLLIFVEGINYAGNLAGVASLPVNVTVAHRLVYEVHDYGYWHNGVASYDAWQAQIQPDWGYLAGTDPLWVGEFGTCNTSALRPRARQASGTYYITNSRSGDVIDIPGSKTANGTDLEQWPLNHGTNQQWKVTALGCGLYSVTSVLDGESVDISGQSTSNGASVDQWSYWGGGNQQFVIAKDAAGSYTIASINSTADVEVPGSSTTAGTLLDQWAPNGGANQEWTFTPA
jgi:hypothetical protein